MIFHNANDFALCFEIAGEEFKVGPGEEVHISPKFDYVPESRGLLLTRGSKGGKVVEATVLDPVQKKLPPGVEVGPEPELVDEGEVPSTEEPTSPEVTRAMGELASQGVTPPSGKRGRGR